MVNGSISPYKALFLRRVYATWKGSVAQLPLVLVYHVSFARAIYTGSPLGVRRGPGVGSKLSGPSCMFKS